jgi:hypothetical protein
MAAILFLYKRFIKGVVLVIVVCYTRGFSKEWFLSLWYVIQEVYHCVSLKRMANVDTNMMC